MNVDLLVLLKSLHCRLWINGQILTLISQWRVQNKYVTCFIVDSKSFVLYASSTDFHHPQPKSMPT